VSRFAKSWHVWCVRPKVQPTLSWTRAQQAENRDTFSQNRVTIEHLENMLSALPKSWHAYEIVSQFLCSSKTQIWSQIQHSPPWLLIGDDVNITINHHAALSKRELLFNKLDQVQAMLEPWSRQWLGKHIRWILFRCHFFHHNLFWFNHVSHKVETNVNVLFPLMTHLMIRQVNDTLAITMYLHTFLSNS